MHAVADERMRTMFDAADATAVKDATSDFYCSRRHARRID